MGRLLSILRSALYLVFLAVTVVPWSLTVVLASIFMRGNPVYWMCAGWLRTAILGARWICGVRWRIQGMEHLPKGKTEAVLLAAKHQSTWETFAFPALMPHPLAYVFKRELLYIPFFGWAMARLDMIHIDRSKRTEAWNKVASQGRKFMSHGTWVIMFPEGTRVPRGEQGRYQSGAARLALATGVPLVPVAVTSARCWPRKSWLLRPGVIDISIGAPIPVAGRSAESLTREVQGWIEAEMRRLDPEAYAADGVHPAAAART
ncbi:lysophospholipid acyltransferase family protein [Azohydromonas caseinilytica]|uniref:1-acyl-sn-glycerol-3-phosphate acyltransferase n=1 Tax=Azohydromonas caseinilytica TaxID=2728836 RepID=A0A848F812_9BURK|nr:lysophospholipid acyltransferase family protein [Azohydromonas caseinilytica]NML15328.1 1-acyl-sn-glycerol-3-phosphate acyltransferase [Azohydromonas caseinilytica]